MAFQKWESLEARFWSKVEKTETCWIWKRPGPLGYGYFRIDSNPPQPAHRIAYTWGCGAIPEGAQVDHICFNRACVRPDHLRLVTQKQNQEHRVGATRRSTTGVRGVFWRSDRGKYAVQVGHHGRVVHGGHFNTLEEAADRAAELRAQLYTHDDYDQWKKVIA